MYLIMETMENTPTSPFFVDVWPWRVSLTSWRFDSAEYKRVDKKLWQKALKLCAPLQESELIDQTFTWYNLQGFTLFVVL